MKKAGKKAAPAAISNPQQQPMSTVQEYLNLCAAIGERAYKVHCLQGEIEQGYAKARELEKQIMAEQKAVQAIKEEAQKEAEKTLG